MAEELRSVQIVSHLKNWQDRSGIFEPALEKNMKLSEGKQCSFVVLKRWEYGKDALILFLLAAFSTCFGYWKLNVWTETGESDNQLKTNDLLECFICITGRFIVFCWPIIVWTIMSLLISIFLFIFS